MSKQPWFESLKSDRLLMVHLIQCDLAKHTVWFKKCIDQGLAAMATKAKKELACGFEKVVAPSFALIFWGGDGGMYAAKQEGIAGDDVVKMARNLYAEFLEWQNCSEWSALHLERLALRLCCHTCNVWVGNEPAYWTSVGLNRFVKYERELSHEDTLAITHPTFEHLETLGPQFSECKQTVWLPDREPVKWVIHYDSEVSPRKAVETTIGWFKEKFGTSVQVDDQVTAESQRFALGEAVVLLIAGSSEDELDLELQEDRLPEFKWLSKEELAGWKYYEEEVIEELHAAQDPRKQVDLEKACPLELRMPLKDFPIAKITYAPIKYSKARSFLTCLTKRRELWTKLANGGVDYTPDAPRRPGILCAHVIVLTNEEERGPHVILAQRSKRQKEHVGFHLGLWSASFAEQVERNDGSIRNTVIRGLREELLKTDADKVSINVAALFLERSVLNLTVGVVCRTTLSFEEVHELWWDCDDRDENIQIVALPLKEHLIKECIKTGKLTDNARSECLVRPCARNVWKSTRGWELHPTSPLRLALALRAVQAQ